MNDVYTLISSDEITYDDVVRLLRQCGGTIFTNHIYIGVISYETNHMWAYLDDPSDEDEPSLHQEATLLGAPPRTFLSLEPSSDDTSISFQLVFDFAYLCMQQYNCVLKNPFEEDDFFDKKLVSEIYEERRLSEEVPRLE